MVIIDIKKDSDFKKVDKEIIRIANHETLRLFKRVRNASYRISQHIIRSLRARLANAPYSSRSKKPGPWSRYGGRPSERSVRLKTTQKAYRIYIENSGLNRRDVLKPSEYLQIDKHGPAHHVYDAVDSAIEKLFKILERLWGEHMAALKSKNISIKILKDTNKIDPSSLTTDWADQTSDIELTGFIKSMKLDEPEPTRETINYLGSDVNGVQLQESYIDEWGSAKISGTMIVNPDGDGNYKALDELFLTEVASDGSTTFNYKYGAEVSSDADLLVVIGSDAGVRLLMKSFKINKLNSFDAPDKGVIEVSFEFECLAGDLYKQVVKA